MKPMIALMLANTRAAELRAQAAGGDYSGGPSVLKGAATHSGAFLLQALEEMGWSLVPSTPSTPSVEERDCYRKALKYIADHADDECQDAGCLISAAASALSRAHTVPALDEQGEAA